MNHVFIFQYPLDRIGSCNFHLKEPDGKAIVHKVSFNTSTTEVTGSWMEELFKGGAKIWKQCDSVDMVSEICNIKHLKTLHCSSTNLIKFCFRFDW